MSEATDWTLIVRASQKAQIAAEAALEITGRLKLEIGLRLDGLEGGLGTLEGRAASLAAGQDSLHRAVLRIADTLIDHSARFDAIDKNLADIAARLP